MPCSWQSGQISRCMRRSNRWYPYCTTSTLPTAMQASISSGLKLESPMWRILPSWTSSPRASMVSSKGTSRSGQWIM